jgi:7-cyano-7-deazaguanine synthase
LNRIAVLTSGGLDSSVLLAEEAKTAEVCPIYVRCGLAWEDAERKALDSFMSSLNSPNVRPVTTLYAPVRPMYGDHWSVGTNAVPGAEEPDTSVFLPGRNILLIGLAAVWCSTHHVVRIAIGSLGGNPFPDAKPEFFQKFATALSSGLDHVVEVRAAFRELQKSDVIKRFKDLPLELTMTCMAPPDGMHCGKCNKCRERQVAFARSGVPDLTTYASAETRFGIRRRLALAITEK